MPPGKPEMKVAADGSTEPQQELAGEAEGGDEEQVVKVVGAGQAEAADHVVDVDGVDDGQRPRRRGAKERGVRVDTRVAAFIGSPPRWSTPPSGPSGR